MLAAHLPNPAVQLAAVPAAYAPIFVHWRGLGGSGVSYLGKGDVSDSVLDVVSPVGPGCSGGLPRPGRAPAH